MKTVEQARQERAEARARGKFHLAHFPYGTIVEIESPNGRYLEESERPTEYDRHERSVHTVVGIRNNGPDSWVLQFAEQCPLTKGLNGANICYVRRIIKRGDGTLQGEEKTLVDNIRAGEEVRDAEDLKRWKRQVIPSFAKGTYRTLSVNELVRNYLKNVANHRDPDHLYDIDDIIKHVCRVVQPRWDEKGFWSFATVSKKKFHRAMKSALAHCKVGRAQKSREEDAEEMARMERELDAEMDLY